MACGVQCSTCCTVNGPSVDAKTGPTVMVAEPMSPAPAASVAVVLLCGDMKCSAVLRSRCRHGPALAAVLATADVAAVLGIMPTRSQFKNAGLRSFPS